MNAPGDDTGHRSEAAAGTIVADLADRLAEPAAVVARMTAEANALTAPDGSRQPAWSALSLGDGYPGLTLLYAELGHLDSRYRKVAHTYLSHAVAHSTNAPPGGLYAGPVALAFAASCAARSPGDYAGVLEPLDRSIAAWVPARLRNEWERMEAGRPGTTFALYDVVSGMAGVGRYLLRRGGETRPALDEILSYLTALTGPYAADAGVPGWWVTHPPHLLTPPANGHGGHANLGLAHGIPGPLALLALAWQEGIRVPGQEEAIVRIVDWLLDWRISDLAGPDWPATLEAADLAGSSDRLPPARSAWCYGVPGLARALQLAGEALGRPEWMSLAVDAVRAMLDRPDGLHGVVDPGLCHGWAGLLHLARLIGIDSGDPRLLGAAAGLAARVVDCYDERAPFGFRVTTPPVPGTVDLAGFLEGAAGVVLALLPYLNGGRPATGWDAALLVR